MGQVATTLLNTQSPALDPRVVNTVKIWPACIPLEGVSSMLEIELASRRMANRKAAWTSFCRTAKRIFSTEIVLFDFYLQYHLQHKAVGNGATTMEGCIDQGAAQEGVFRVAHATQGLLEAAATWLGDYCEREGFLPEEQSDF